MLRCCAVHIFVGTLLFFSLPAHAQRSSPAAELADPRDDSDESTVVEHPRTVTAELGFTTTFPTIVGAYAQTELWQRLQFRLDFGAVPAGYGRAVSNIAGSLGASDVTQALIDVISERAFVLRMGVGLRPSPRAGFEMRVGYIRMHKNIASLPREALPASIAQYAEGSSAEATSHGFEAVLSYRFIFLNRLALRFNLGYSHAVNLKGHINYTGNAVSQETIQSELDARFARVERNMRGPTIGFDFGLRL